MSWLESVIRYMPAYDTIAEVRAVSPAPQFSQLVFCEGNSCFYRWKLNATGADDGDLTLAPSNPADVNRGRWSKIAISGGGGGGTLAGDASGPAGTNVVTHVTGTTNTKVNGTTSVAAQVAGVDVATVDGTGLTLGSADVHYLHGAGAPTVSAPNGSQYLRTDGTSTTTLYVRVSGAWVAR